MTAYRPALEGTPSLAASWMLMRAATVVQVLQGLFYVLLHVLFYLWSLLNRQWQSIASTIKIYNDVEASNTPLSMLCNNATRAKVVNPSGTKWIIAAFDGNTSDQTYWYIDSLQRCSSVQTPTSLHPTFHMLDHKVLLNVLSRRKLFFNKIMFVRTRSLSNAIAFSI